MKYTLFFLTVFLFIPFFQISAKDKDRPGIPTVIYTYYYKNGSLVKKIIIDCDKNKSYNCFDLVNKEDRPLITLEEYQNNEYAKLQYIKDGIKYEEQGLLQRYKADIKGGLSTYTIEMTQIK